LSKAAGDWSFAICELDRITSWQVHHYILQLIEGKHGDRDLHPKNIWQSEGQPTVAPIMPAHGESQAPSADVQPEWVKWANSFFQELWNVVIRNSAYRDSVAGTVDAFTRSWPQGADTRVLADNMFRIVGHREEVIVFVSSLFAAGTVEQRDVAGKLDDMLLDKFLSNLPSDGRKAAGYLPFRERNEYLLHIGQTIARMPTSTNFVRARLNPILHALVQIIETQRFEFGLSSEALETGICLVSVGLEVAIASEAAKEKFRVGMAADYVHWIGRLTRSEAAYSRFDPDKTFPDTSRDDLSFAAQQVLAARKVLGEKLEVAIQKVLEDPLVLSGFKNMLVVNA
jgi:hypothetical protein